MTAMSNSNITDVSAARMCSNCGACSTICPTDAIGFKFSNIGRLYAVVDDENASIAVCAAKRVRRSICRTCIPPIPIHISGKLTTSLWGGVPTSSCLSIRRVAGHARQRFSTCSEPAKLMPRLCAGWMRGIPPW